MACREGRFQVCHFGLSSFSKCRADRPEQALAGFRRGHAAGGAGEQTRGQPGLSSPLIVWLRADCETPSFAAARVKLPSRERRPRRPRGRSRSRAALMSSSHDSMLDLSASHKSGQGRHSSGKRKAVGMRWTPEVLTPFRRRRPSLSSRIRTARTSTTKQQGEELMQKRMLGKSGLEVSALGLGCMGLSYGYGPPTERPTRSASSAPPSSAASPSSTPPKPTVLQQRGAPRRGAAPIRDQVVIATKFGFKDGVVAKARTAGPSASARSPRQR